MEFDNSKRDYKAISRYIDQLYDWGISIDHEDGSTAPFTSLALEESIPLWLR